MTASKDASPMSRFSPSITRVATLLSPAARASCAAKSRMLAEMSVASTAPVGPTRRAACRVCPPAPAAMSSTRAPLLISARSSMRSVASPNHASSCGPQRCQASAASCHCRRVVSLYAAGSNVVVMAYLLDPAQQIRLRDLVQELGVVRAHMRPDLLHHLVLGVCARDESTFASDLLCHVRSLRRSTVYKREVGDILAQCWGAPKSSSAAGWSSSSTVSDWRTGYRVARAGGCSPSLSSTVTGR